VPGPAGRTVPRRSRRLELSLLLAVAPLVGCDGPEDRRCVGPDGVYLQDRCCEATAACHVPGSHYVYVPRRHYTGVGSHSGSWLSHTSPSPSRASFISRGGFGHTGSGHVGGG
jgi:hypothetical protein